MPSPPEIMTLKEAAAWLRLSERALYDLARQRRLPAAQIGGKMAVPVPRWASGWVARRRRRTPHHPAPILAGSHDPLLDWASANPAAAWRSGGREPRRADGVGAA